MFNPDAIAPLTTSHWCLLKLRKHRRCHGTFGRGAVGAGFTANVPSMSDNMTKPALLERRSSIPKNRVSRQDDNAISTFHPNKPGLLTDILGVEGANK
ncbi:hypothetical protein [Coleofasciculus sp. F4-SAH-05]|uniref:hypothetical protein n=1 Tax=Coleofasciculus sp. F4-SAH-05 TaxID=3069525 RepID=UPI003303545E